MPPPAASSSRRKSSRDFDRLAHVYRALEFLAFGRDLERARFCHLERLRTRRSILMLGEGDGRCLARVANLAPEAQIHCVDISREMLAMTEHRLADPAVRRRVTLTCADLFQLNLPPRHYDAVTTLFFLDCFTAPRVAEAVERIQPSLQPGSLWLFSDFVLPSAGWRRTRARAWVSLLYWFFRWQTGITTRELPDSEAAIERAGFTRESVGEFQHGLLRAAVYRR